MSIKELETTWNQQPNHSSPSSEALALIAKTKKSFSKTILAIASMLLLVLVVFGSKIHRIWIDPERGFGDSIWDLTLTGMGVACVLFAINCLMRFNREFRALGQNTRHCVELLIRNVDEEIRSIRRDTPIMFLIFLVLFGLAKWEAVRAGLESPSEWVLLIFVATAFSICGGILYHRMNAFLKPRSSALKQLLRELSAET
ncbi:MAG: hypothetical protein HOH58_15525 [Opitutaceae bacterium]|jgi:hypothetical protein|nr:hypothetical protein [Opitutaceae bacterium]